MSNTPPVTPTPVAAPTIIYNPPVYNAPVYQAPTYQAPVYNAPTYNAPSYTIPTYTAPTVPTQTLTAGQCGTSVNSCVQGAFADLADFGTTALWSCTGTNGSPLTCSAQNIIPPVVLTAGQCGTAINACIAGSFGDLADVGDTAHWTCTGTNGSPVACSQSNPVICDIGQYRSG